MLSCSCDEWDGEGWYYIPPNDFSELSLLETRKRKRCCSCNMLINFNEYCLEFERLRSPRSYIEESIYCDTVPLSSYYMCFDCGGIFLNLENLGYCINIEEPMRTLLEEYQDMTGFTKT